jgi:hypothetical protein
VTGQGDDRERKDCARGADPSQRRREVSGYSEPVRVLLRVPAVMGSIVFCACDEAPSSPAQSAAGTVRIVFLGSKLRQLGWRCVAPTPRRMPPPRPEDRIVASCKVHNDGEKKRKAHLNGGRPNCAQHSRPDTSANEIPC